MSVELPTVPWWTSQRFLLAIICFFGFVVLYAQRVNLSIAIVSMVAYDHADHLAAGNGSGLFGNGTSGLRYAGNASSGSVSVLYSTTTAAGQAEEDLCPEIAQSAKTVGSPLWGAVFGRVGGWVGVGGGGWVGVDVVVGVSV